jgi:hypothetical protein
VAGKKRDALPFDKAGGVVVIQRRLIKSAAFREMSLAARCLLPLLQSQWRNDRAIGYGTREAAAELDCSHRVAMQALRELHERGFIRLEDESMFNSRTGSRARSWVLTWLPFMGKPPTNEWEAKKSTGA